MIATRRSGVTFGTNKVRVLRPRPAAFNIRKSFLAAAVIVSIMTAVVALQNHCLVQNEYELWSMKQEWLNVAKQNEQLKLEVAQMKSPIRIQQIAATKIGMVVPATVYQVGVKSDNIDARVADASSDTGNTN